MGRGTWDVGRGTWEVGRGTWDVGRGKWEVEKASLSRRPKPHHLMNCERAVRRCRAALSQFGGCGGTGPPTKSLHPLDVKTLMRVFEHLIEHGATVIVIEHDLDVIRNADDIINMGPGGGQDSGRIVAIDIPDNIKNNKRSITGRYL